MATTSSSFDPRRTPPPRAGERETLNGFLRRQRQTLELKCSGLGPADLATRAVEPSALSLLGLLRHLAEAERHWFKRILGMSVIPDVHSEESWDGATANPDVVAQAWQAWREEVAFAERFVEEAPDLDITGEDPDLGLVSLRWVLVHMVEEYARHNGHADLLRERIDGTVGE
jgi:uncharacterized damage-inducible protein DinB